ncbi:MAG: hypothetical protein F4219_00275 [Gammaproteobacteria bacterium]|nr:hypothetical protein [Gammaproteobacteria bacterium]
MNRYILHYTLKNHNWLGYVSVENQISSLGNAWRHNVCPTILRLDSELSPMQLQSQMNSFLDLKNGDTYYVAQISEYRSKCSWTKLN